MATMYTGKLQTAAQAARWEKRLAELGQHAAGSLLRRNWRAIAARPALAAQLAAMVGE